jgi:hypothetical protein
MAATGRFRLNFFFVFGIFVKDVLNVVLLHAQNQSRSARAIPTPTVVCAIVTPHAGCGYMAYDLCSEGLAP